MYTTILFFIHYKVQEFARARTLRVTHRLHTSIIILAAAAKSHPIVVDTSRRATIHRQWIDCVSVGIIRQQAAKRTSKYKLQNTHRILDVSAVAKSHPIVVDMSRRATIHRSGQIVCQLALFDGKPPKERANISYKTLTAFIDVSALHDDDDAQ